MKNKTSLLVIACLLFAGVCQAQYHDRYADRRDIREDRYENFRDRTDIANDIYCDRPGALRRDRREYTEDRRDFFHDRRDLRFDRGQVFYRHIDEGHRY